MDEFTVVQQALTKTESGPIIRTPDISGVLSKLEVNTWEMRQGRFNPDVTRSLLLRYLDVCGLLQFASSHSYIYKARSVLTGHALAIPSVNALSEDCPEWSEVVEKRLISLGAVPDSWSIRCDFGVHYPDHLWFAYSVDRTHSSGVRVIEYFGRGIGRSIEVGVVGLLSERYERCDCGRWFRPLSVF